MSKLPPLPNSLRITAPPDRKAGQTILRIEFIGDAKGYRMRAEFVADSALEIITEALGLSLAALDVVMFDIDTMLALDETHANAKDAFARAAAALRQHARDHFLKTQEVKGCTITTPNDQEPPR